MICEHGNLLVDVVINGPFVQNCYLIADKSTRQGVVIDPGLDVELIMRRIKELELTIQEILCTHGHVDHVGAAAILKQRLQVPFAIHEKERVLLSNLSTQTAMFGLAHHEPPDVEHFLEHEEMLPMGNFEIKVLFTPGHSAGGCCFYVPKAQVLFAGDTLFLDSIGRTDLPGGSLETLLASIRNRLLTLDDSVIVYSGHGNSTTIGAERRNNPFLAVSNSSDPTRNC